jgi:hypothetical protein
MYLGDADGLKNRTIFREKIGIILYFAISL